MLEQCIHSSDKDDGFQQMYYMSELNIFIWSILVAFIIIVPKVFNFWYFKIFSHRKITEIHKILVQFHQILFDQYD